MEDIETANRSYTMSTSKGKDGKLYLNMNDDKARKFEFRPVASEVVFGDALTGTWYFGQHCWCHRVYSQVQWCHEGGHV